MRLRWSVAIFLLTAVGIGTYIAIESRHPHAKEFYERSECWHSLFRVGELLEWVEDNASREMDTYEDKMTQDEIRCRLQAYLKKYYGELPASETLNRYSCPLSDKPLVPFHGYVFHPLLLTRHRNTLSVRVLESHLHPDRSKKQGWVQISHGLIRVDEGHMFYVGQIVYEASPRSNLSAHASRIERFVCGEPQAGKIHGFTTDVLDR